MPCDAQKDLTSHAGVCAGRGMGRKPAIPPPYLRTSFESRSVVMQDFILYWAGVPTWGGDGPCEER
jgi:hypothetical protein